MSMSHWALSHMLQLPVVGCSPSCEILIGVELVSIQRNSISS